MSKVFLRVLAGILIIVLGVTIWGIYKNVTEKGTIEDKIEVEIAYLDESITEIINYLNNITINMYNVSENSSEEQQNQSGQRRIKQFKWRLTKWFIRRRSISRK